MEQYKEECIRTYKVFEHFEIKMKDGKKEVYIDGNKLDLSNVISVNVNLDGNGVTLVINSIRYNN